jgi:hypothetical protein
VYPRARSLALGRVPKGRARKRVFCVADGYRCMSALQFWPGIFKPQANAVQTGQPNARPGHPWCSCPRLPPTTLSRQRHPSVATPRASCCSFTRAPCLLRSPPLSINRDRHVGSPAPRSTPLKFKRPPKESLRASVLSRHPPGTSTDRLSWSFLSLIAEGAAGHLALQTSRDLWIKVEGNTQGQYQLLRVAPSVARRP